MGSTSPKQIIEQSDDEQLICSRCGSVMIHRKSARGQFYGCSTFPKCRNTEAV
ncbi:topoisomerase DNA-binding C4 zinc finger domain-containing protein [Paenibacillus castaneae]|uniref:topoisomerase DNA-binding C4 zinc finger domain-containing protein n=1 Tax=Paenibacillus castaneae TaxID=474957 RepID=UPI001ABA061C|nr:topoisomerase DNA-binding C4 zinc finger domain-containing protein [Paenibacillus castaneae]